MIPRITRGGSGYGALSYDHGPGRRDEHTNAHKVGGNIAGKGWKQRSAAMDDHVRRMQPKLTKPITRTSLRLAPEDRNLSDREWRAVAERYVQKMGYADSPWEAVRHADDHIHLTMSRVKWDGGVVDQWKDKTRAQSVVRGIEREHGLIDASRRYNRDVPQLSRNDVERAARAAESTGKTVDPEKQQLRERVSAAEGDSHGHRAGFERALTAHGVHFRANVSRPTERNPDGKMNGYSYRLDGHTDRDGQPVWFKASQLGPRYSWTQTERRLDRLGTEAATGTTATDTAAVRRTEADDAAVRAPHQHDRDTVESSGTDERKKDRQDRDDDRDEARTTPGESDADTRRQDADDADEPKRSDRTDADREPDAKQRAENRAEARQDDARRDEPARGDEVPPQHREPVQADRDDTTSTPERRTDDGGAAEGRRQEPDADRLETSREPRNREQVSERERPEVERGQDRPTSAVNDRSQTPTEGRSPSDDDTQRDKAKSPREQSGDDRARNGEKAGESVADTARERAQDRARQWAQERRDRSRPVERSHSPETARPDSSNDERVRQSASAEPGEQNPRVNVVRNGKDEAQRGASPQRPTSPEQPERTEGEQSMSKSQQRETAERDPKEQARERAEKWAQERKERGQENDRDRGPERDR